MKRSRFGHGTSIIYFLVAFMGAGLIGIFAFQDNPWLMLATQVLWVVFCTTLLDGFLYPALKKPVYSTDGHYVDIDLWSHPFYMNHGGRTVSVQVLFMPENRPVLSVYDNHLQGSGRVCNGENQQLVQTLAGDLTVKRTKNGFQLSWSDDQDWKMGIGSAPNA